MAQNDHPDDVLTRMREADGAELAEHMATLEAAVQRLPSNASVRVIGLGVLLLARAIEELRADIAAKSQDREARLERVEESVAGLVARESL